MTTEEIKRAIRESGLELGLGTWSQPRELVQCQNDTCNQGTATCRTSSECASGCSSGSCLDPGCSRRNCTT